MFPTKKAVEKGASLVEMSKGAADEDSITELLQKCEMQHKMMGNTVRDCRVTRQVDYQLLLSSKHKFRHSTACGHTG